MAGVSGSLDVNQAAQYGDKTALDNVRAGMTSTPMTGNPIPKPGPGRPATGQQQPTAAPQPREAEQMPAEHMSLMQEVAQAYRTKVFWDNVLKNYPSEWSRLYASDASQTYKRLAEQLRTSTPFFE